MWQSILLIDMKHADYLPNEISTGFATMIEMDQNPSVQAFLDSLNEEQARRFEEFAHHFFYIGMEYGATRKNLAITEAQQAKLLIHETTLYAKGAGEALDPTTP